MQTTYSLTVSFSSMYLYCAPSMTFEDKTKFAADQVMQFADGAIVELSDRDWEALLYAEPNSDADRERLQRRRDECKRFADELKTAMSEVADQLQHTHLANVLVHCLIPTGRTALDSKRWRADDAIKGLNKAGWRLWEVRYASTSLSPTPSHSRVPSGAYNSALDESIHSEDGAPASLHDGVRSPRPLDVRTPPPPSLFRSVPASMGCIERHCIHSRNYISA